MVQLSRHLMYGGSGNPTTRVQRALVRVQSGKGRQQGRMNIEQSSCIKRHERRREDTHEAGQHHEYTLLRFTIPIDKFRQCAIKAFPGCKRRMV